MNKLIKLRRWLKHHRLLSTALCVVTLLILAVAYNLVFLHEASLHGGILQGDYDFHNIRLNEIGHDLINGGLPLVNSNYGYPRGIADSIFYPWLVVAPFGLLDYLMKSPIKAYFLSMLIIQFGAYSSAFFSYRTFDRSKLHALIFSMIYGSTMTFLFVLYISEAYGAVTATAVLPVAVFGFIALIEKNRWRMLSVGMVLLAYSHVLTTVMAVMMLSAISLFELKLFDKSKIRALFKAVIVVIALTIFEWLPLAYIMLKNKIEVPKMAPSQFSNGIFNYSSLTPGFILPLTAIVAYLIRCQRCRPTRLDKAMMMITAGTWLINIKLVASIIYILIPPMRIFQFINRFSVIGDIASAYLILRLLAAHRGKQIIKYLIILVLVIQSGVNLIGLTNQYRQARPLTFNAYKRWLYPVNQVIVYNRIMSNHDFNNYSNRLWNFDYLPLKSEKFKDQDFNHAIGKDHVKATRHGIVVRSKRTYRNVYLPIIVYHGIQYRFKLNGRTLKSKQINWRKTWQYQRLNLRLLPAGRNKIAIKSAKLF